MDLESIIARRKKGWDRLLTIRKEKPSKVNIRPLRRIRMIADDGSFKELDRDLKSGNPIDFPGYPEKLSKCMESTGHNEAIVTGVCKIKGIRTAIGVMDPEFLMGSMGTVVGQKIIRLADYAGRKKLPLIIFSASGGARMQEGLFSLMQMAGTSGAIQRFKDGGGLFISVLTNPTTGGVSASFASLGDIIIGEPGALIGFAGPRVIEQTIGQKLPEGFQRAEFLMEHGMVDMILDRKDQREVIGRILRLHKA